MITIQRETVDSFYEDAKPLFEEDWKETVTYSNAISLNVDLDVYRKLESANRLFMFSARDDGKVVGYLGFIISQSFQTKTLIAECIGLFIIKEYRGKGLWKPLLEANKAGLSAAGVKRLRIHTSPINDISVLLEKAGMEKEETVYGMAI